MSRRIVGINNNTYEEVPIGSDDLIMTSADRDAPNQSLILEHCRFRILDKSDLYVLNPYVAVVLGGDPLVHHKEKSVWRSHRFNSGQLTVKGIGDLGACQSSDDCEVLLLSIDRNAMSRVALQMGLSEDTGLKETFLATDEFLKELVLTIRSEVEQGYPGGKLLFDSLETTVCAYLLTHYAATESASPLRRVTQGLSDHALKRVEEFIHQNLNSDISMTDLANVACFSPYHFSRMFKKTTGTSPYNYFSNLRARKAADMMAAGCDDVAYIARTVGFRDSRALYRQFKRLFGETPTAFIKRVR